MGDVGGEAKRLWNAGARENVSQCNATQSPRQFGVDDGIIR